jgi:hypothetical protein
MGSRSDPGPAAAPPADAPLDELTSLLQRFTLGPPDDQAGPPARPVPAGPRGTKRGRSGSPEAQPAKRGRTRAGAADGDASWVPAPLPVPSSASMTQARAAGEIDVALPRFDGEIADVTSVAFTAAVADLARELGELTGVAGLPGLGDWITALIRDGWIADVPGAADLPGLLAELAGTDPAEATAGSFPLTALLAAITGENQPES